MHLLVIVIFNERFFAMIKIFKIWSWGPREVAVHICYIQGKIFIECICYSSIPPFRPPLSIGLVCKSFNDYQKKDLWCLLSFSVVLIFSSYIVIGINVINLSTNILDCMLHEMWPIKQGKSQEILKNPHLHLFFKLKRFSLPSLILGFLDNCDMF